VVIEFHGVEGQYNQLLKFAADLVRRQVSVICPVASRMTAKASLPGRSVRGDIIGRVEAAISHIVPVEPRAG
jgi:hypothetical protein